MLNQLRSKLLANIPNLLAPYSGNDLSPSAPRSSAISLLEKDHKTVHKLLTQLDKARERKRRQDLLRKVEKEIKIHTKIEEKIFYPAFKEAAKTKQDNIIFFEAHAEHNLADLVLAEMKKEKIDSDQFAAKAKVLKYLVEHHAEEKENEMFPRVKKLLSNEELEALGERLQDEKAILAKKYT